MSYERAMGTEVDPGGCRTAEQIRQHHEQMIEELSQGNAIQQAQAAAARVAASLTDEQLDARRAAVGEAERRVQEELRAALGTPAYDALRAELSRVRNEERGLQLEWATRDRMARDPAQCARIEAQQHEVDNMWTSGQWRDHDVYNRWLDQQFASINPLRYWFASAHCSVVGPSGGSQPRCANYAPPNRPLAIGLTLLPFAAGYWAWKKKDRSIPWTVAAVTAGVAGPPLISAALFLGALVASGGVRY